MNYFKYLNTTINHYIKTISLKHSLQKTCVQQYNMKKIYYQNTLHYINFKTFNIDLIFSKNIVIN